MVGFQPTANSCIRLWEYEVLDNMNVPLAERCVRPAFLNWRQMLPFGLVLLSAALDLGTLLRNYATIGLAAEANPFAANVLATYGPAGIGLAKMGGAVFVIAAVVALRRLRCFGLAKALVAIAVILNGFGFLSNLWV